MLLWLEVNSIRQWCFYISHLISYQSIKCWMNGSPTMNVTYIKCWMNDHLLCVQFISVAQSTLCDPVNRSTPGLPVHHQLPKFTQTRVHRVGDAIQPSHPLLAPSPPAPNPSQHQSLFNESTLRMRWPKYWSFSFNIISSKEHPGPISSRMDWLNLLAVQRTLKSLLQNHSSIQFFGTQLSSQSNSHIHTWHWKNQSLD